MICDNCGKADLEIVLGWESDKALKCPRCGQYHYWVCGRIHCSMIGGIGKLDEKEARRILGLI